MSKTASTIAEYEQALHQMLDENEALRSDLADANGQISVLLEWIMGDADALTVLQRVYLDPNETPANRIKAAASAIGFEKPRLAASAHVVIDFAERVKRARLAATAKLIEQAKVIEHDPPALPEPA